MRGLARARIARAGTPRQARSLTDNSCRRIRIEPEHFQERATIFHCDEDADEFSDETHGYCLEMKAGRMNDSLNFSS
jgi:hypothetical protein